MRYITNLSDLLQKDLLALGVLLALSKQQLTLLIADAWNLFWEEAFAFARHHEIEIVTPRRQ